MNKTLCYLSTYYDPIIGGVERYTKEVATAAAKRGYDTHILTSDRKGRDRFSSNEKMGGINIHRMRVWFRFSLNFVFYPSLIWKLFSLKPDVIIVNYLGIFWHDFCLVVYKLVHPRCVIVNTPMDKFMGHTYSPVLRAVRWVYLRIQSHFVPWLYCGFFQINPSQKTWLVKDFKIDAGKIRLATPGIPEDALTKRDASLFIKKYTLTSKHIVSYIGRIERYKGIGSVVDALPDIMSHYPDAVFIIGGKHTEYVGELTNKTSTLGVDNHVLFIDTPGEEEKYTILAASNIFATPSSSEGFGITSVEAMSQGNAIITVKNEGSEFLITEGENGLFVGAGDAKNIARAIVQLWSNDDLRKNIIELNYKKAKEFTWEHILNDIYFPYIEELRQTVIITR